MQFIPTLKSRSHIRIQITSTKLALPHLRPSIATETSQGSISLCAGISKAADAGLSVEGGVSVGTSIWIVIPKFKMIHIHVKLAVLIACDRIPKRVILRRQEVEHVWCSFTGGHWTGGEVSLESEARFCFLWLHHRFSERHYAGSIFLFRQEAIYKFFIERAFFFCKLRTRAIFRTEIHLVVGIYALDAELSHHCFRSDELVLLHRIFFVFQSLLFFEQRLIVFVLPNHRVRQFFTLSL